MSVRPAAVRAALCLLLALAAGTLGAEPRVLDGPWSFRAGDDPAWADPRLDDGDWERRTLPDVWRAPGYPESGQIAWYRLEVDVADLLARRQPIGLRVEAIRNAHEVWVGGHRIGGLGALPPDAEIGHDRVRVHALPPQLAGRDRRVLIALRVWGGSEASIAASGGGPYGGAPRIGPYAELLADVAAEDRPRLVFASLFAFVGLYFLYLWLRNRSLASFAWFGVTALVVALYSLTQTQWKYETGLSFLVLEKLESVSTFLMLVLLVQQFYSVLDERPTRFVRAYQGLFLAFAWVYALTPGLAAQYLLKPVWQIAALAVLPSITILVVRESLAGRRDARILLFGFVVFTTTALHDLAVNAALIQGTPVIPIGFVAVLGSMAAILAGRFTDLLASLEAEVARRTEELRAANEQLHAANASLKSRAVLDALTGLLNRAGFVEEVREEEARVARHGVAYALVIGDVDHFKRFNDDFGHACGDAVLKQVAGALRARTREVDRVGRWGGEEFVVLLPRTDADGVGRAAEKLRAAVEAAPLEFEGRAHAITASFGAAVLRAGEDFEACLERADGALYRAKAAGRNRVVVDD